jgi:hypothetical protein
LTPALSCRTGPPVYVACEPVVWLQVAIIGRINWRYFEKDVSSDFHISVAGGHAVTLAVDAADVTAIAFVIAVPCNPDVADLPPFGGVPGVV